MKLKALLVAGAVAAGLFATAAPAAAYCNMTLYKLTGYCSECTIVSGAYYEATGKDLGLTCVD